MNAPCNSQPTETPTTRTLRIHLSADLGDGRHLVAVSIFAPDGRTGGMTETEYGVMLSKYAARWRKTEKDAGTDRRTHGEPYTVAIGRDGRATGCTCPDRLYRGRVCKHMAATEKLVCRVRESAGNSSAVA